MLAFLFNNKTRRKSHLKPNKIYSGKVSAPKVGIAENRTSTKHSSITGKCSNKATRVAKQSSFVFIRPIIVIERRAFCHSM